MFKLLKYLLVIIIPFFFFLNPLLPWPKDLIYEAAGHGNGVLAFFDAQKNGNPAPVSWEHASYILGQVFLMIVYKIFGVSTFTTILNTSILAFLTIIVTYLAAKKILGEIGALLTLILFSGSLYFLMIIKTAYPFYGTIPLTVSITYFLFMLAHQKNNQHLLFFSGIGLAFIGISGGQPTPLSLLIIALYLLWKIIRKEKLFSFKKYLFFLLISIGIFCSFHALFPLVNHNKPFEYLPASYRLLSERGGQVSLKGDYNFRKENANRMIKSLFVDMGIPGQGHQQNMAKRAMIPFPISLFFFIGLFAAFRKKTEIDKFFIIWIAVTFLFYSFFADFQVRYFVFVGSAIYLLSAKGILYLFQKTKNNLIIICLVSLSLGLYLRNTYVDYYIVMASKAFKMEIYEGQAEMAEYIKKNYHPQNTFLIFGNVTNIFPQNFILYTWDNPYQFIHWHYFFQNLVYTPVAADIIQGNSTNFENDQTFSDLRKLEKEKLKTYQKLIYVLGYYNGDYTLTKDMQIFRRLHPSLEPVKIIYASTKFPHIAIYEINREESNITRKNLNLNPLSPENFSSLGKKELKSLIIFGKISQNIIYLNNEKLLLPFATSPAQTLLLNFKNNNHHLYFSPIINNDFEKNIFQSKNLLVVPDANLVSGNQNQGGELVFKIEAPSKIKRLNILFFPRIFNDKEKEASLELEYSTSNKDYKNIYQLKSDGTGGWIGAWERQERLIIFPESKTVFLKFKLTGTEVQLLSGLKSTMSFEGDFNWTLNKLEIIPGTNTFRFQGENPLSFSLFY